MATAARDIITKQIDLGVLPSPRSTIVDLQADPRGGYWALVNVPAYDNDAEPAFLLKFDDTHTLLSTHAFSVTNPTDDGYDAINVAAMSVGPQSIFVVGTAAYLRHPGLPSRVFVARFSMDAVLQAVTVYEPILFDGCMFPQPVHCRGVGIVRLPAPNDDRLMVLFQTAVAFDGTGTPRGDDSIAAAVFTIDDNGNVRGTGVHRIFGVGQVMPSRLRVAPNIGPVIVGKTRPPGPSLPWMAYVAWLDATGKVVHDTPYGVGDAPFVVFNDIAEVDGAIIAVGTLRQLDETLRAVAMRIEVPGNIDWTGIYGPVPGNVEWFDTELNVLMTNRDVWIAGGAIATSATLSQPWLVSLTPASPDLVWQKAYSASHTRSEQTSFQSLLHNLPDRVIAGGDISHTASDGPPAVYDVIPFLVASATAPGTSAPICSNETQAVTVRPNANNLAPTFWVDLMPIVATEWLYGQEARQVNDQTLCTGGQPPRG